MSDGVKLFPTIIASLALLFCLKAFGLVTGVSASLTAPALAQEDAAPAEDPTAEDASADPGEAEDGAAGEALTVPPETELSPTEVRVLQSLAKRRATLETRERELETREKLLMAAELRIEERIDELKAVETRIEDLLGKRDAEEMAQIERLVKVYERMKPKDAAKIFETLDQDILLDVASRMKEATVAGVMAQMSPAAAQSLTVMLATRHNLPEDAGQEQGI
ncbi:MAG: hypothetical protein AAGL49_12115 [Pseudomonadota bacterium]